MWRTCRRTSILRKGHLYNPIDPQLEEIDMEGAEEAEPTDSFIFVLKTGHCNPKERPTDAMRNRLCFPKLEIALPWTAAGERPVERSGLADDCVDPFNIATESAWGQNGGKLQKVGFVEIELCC